jgi:hypothetical protein
MHTCSQFRYPNDDAVMTYIGDRFNADFDSRATNADGELLTHPSPFSPLPKEADRE